VVFKVRWSERASTDLAGIYDYIATDNREAALRLITRLHHSTEKLTEFPLAGRIVPRTRREVREVIVAPYRVAYEIQGDVVEILKVQHGARLLTAESFESEGQ
jgi:toxin ParE1/3/4